MDPHSASSATAGPAPLGFGELLSLATRVLQLDNRAIDTARSPRVELWHALAMVAITGGLSALPGGLPAILGAAILFVLAHLLLCLVLHGLAVGLGGHGDILHLTRGLGVANMINWLGPIPFVGFLARVWFLVIMVRTIARAYGLSTGQAVAVALVPALLLFVGSMMILVGAFSLGLLLG